MMKSPSFRCVTYGADDIRDNYYAIALYEASRKQRPEKFLGTLWKLLTALYANIVQFHVDQVPVDYEELCR